MRRYSTPAEVGHLLRIFSTEITAPVELRVAGNYEHEVLPEPCHFL